MYLVSISKSSLAPGTVTSTQDTEVKGPCLCPQGARSVAMTAPVCFSLSAVTEDWRLGWESRGRGGLPHCKGRSRGSW